MECPQCAAEVPTDNAFCGKCGYAMRDEGPDRTDQSRIRVHEEPTPTRDERPSSPRVRQHTVLGMPPPKSRSEPDVGESSPPAPPSSIAAARAGKKRRQKTIVGIPRAELSSSSPNLPDAASSPDDGADGDDANHGRARKPVQYDSVLEPPAAAVRRRRVFAACAVLVALSTAWLLLRFVNG